MPPTIRQLPDHVANQIAAGEVVERPAAAVKELVENSLDAGATSITVRIEDGGRRLVEVVDDGHGMAAADLRTALGRHATSKLRSAEDLFRVASLGFRGEALPSIAAVSEFELASRPTAAESGSVLRTAGGQEQHHGPEAMPGGTRVRVRNLFWNTPVRLKFLKTQGTETAHVTDMVTRLALAHPGVRFRLEVDGREVLDCPPVDELLPRIRTCLGRQVAEGLIAVDGHADRAQLSGLIGHPAQARATSKRQFVFLNGRPIKDKLVTAAIREGYRGFLDGKLHAVVFLHIDTDPDLVDVNVHPTKAEVRFRRDKEIFHLVRSAIRTALEQEVGNFSLFGGRPEATPDQGGVARRVVKAAPPPTPPAPPAEPALQERFLPRQPSTGGGATPTEPGAAADDQAETATPTPRLGEAAPAYESAPATTAGPPEPTAATPSDLPGIRRVLQLHDMYLLIETDTGIRLVDQHALHEKALWLLLDPARTDFAATGRQELLVPKTIELSAGEVHSIEAQLPQLAACGIEAEVFGPTTLLLRAFPSMLHKLNWTTFFTDLAAQGDGERALTRLREAIGHRRACRGAVKAGDRLSDAEQLELVRLLYTLDDMEHCPHGRPTTLDLSWEELERRFQR